MRATAVPVLVFAAPDASCGRGQTWSDETARTRLRTYQTREHPVVREFTEAQEALGTFLQETNAAISETPGIDFGQTAGSAGGAC